MPKRYLISGYFGYSNPGDEAILEVLLRDLREDAPGAELCVVSGDPVETARQHGVQAIASSDMRGLLDQAATCDGLIVGGGGVFQDYWGVNKETLLTPLHAGIPFYSSLPLLGRLMEKPVLIHAAGVGPLFSKEAEELTHLSFELATLVSVRDAKSQALLASLGLPLDDILVTADPAFRLTPDRQQAANVLANLPLDPQAPRMAVCLRSWELPGLAEDWQAQVAEALDAFIEHTGCNLIFVPFQSLTGSALNDDSITARGVISKLKFADHAILLEGAYTPPVIAGLLAGCDLTLGMRYHSVVFSALGGVPVVALAYDSKVTQVMGDLWLEEFSLPLAGLSGARLLERLKVAWDSRTELRARVEAACREMSSRAAGNRSLVENFVQLKKEKSTNGISRFFKQLSLDQARLLSEKIEAFQDLNGQLASQQRENGKLLERIAEKDAALRSLREEMDFRTRMMSNQNQELTNQLTRIQSSRGWRLLFFLWSIRKWLLPTGSRREHLARTLWRSLHPGSRGIGSTQKTPFNFRPPPPFEERYNIEDNSQVTLYTDDVQLLPENKPRRPLHNDLPDQLQVSLIASVKNEAGNVKEWLRGIQEQTRPPNEIVIVDGGSTDGTVEELEAFALDATISVKVIRAPGANIARARNLATEQASHPIIAVTDFGCRQDRFWLERLLQPFKIEQNTRVSAGFYRSVDRQGRNRSGDGIWPGIAEIDPQHFLPSSRSVAFSKDALDAVGGHPEWLTKTGDDTYLDLELKRLGGEWAFVPEAVVTWVIPDTLTGYLQKMYSWAIGDGESGVHARYYWGYLMRWSGWLAFTLLIAAALIGILMWQPVYTSIWAGLCCLVWVTAVAILTMKEKIPPLRLIQKALGQGAQVLGFLRGARNRKVVDQRREDELKGIFFILSGVPVDDSGGGVRGTQVALELLQKGWGVVFLNKFERDESRDLGVRYHHPHLFVSSVDQFNLDEFSGQHPTLLMNRPVAALIEFPLADFLPLAGRLREEFGAAVAYDSLDDWNTSLGGKWYTPEVEKQITQVSTHLVATLPVLARRLEEISGKKVLLLPNAVNTRLFDPHRLYSRPKDMPEGKRTLIYVGALWGDWFDWELLGGLADSYTESQIVLIGDYRDQAPFNKDNVHFLGLKAHKELPAYLSHADAALLPWKVSAITQATSPLKVYEYLSMWLPVVAPALEPLRDMPGVFLADSRDEYFRLAGSMMRQQLDEEELDKFIQKHNWTARLDELLSYLQVTG